jgi:hypothetical protein
MTLQQSPPKNIRGTTCMGVNILSRLRGLRVTYKTGFGLDDWIYCALCIHTVRDNSASAILHILQFTVTHVLGFSVFISRILATDLSQSHCNFKSHMKSCFRNLIPFFPLFCCQFRRLGSIQFLRSQTHTLAGWCRETRLFTSRLPCFTRLHCSVLGRVFCVRLQPLARTTQKIASLLFRRLVFWSVV